jgi:exopolyphosphatase/guanosine-5'-triphosphate,3'-diphosphate pyrophosphatase
VALSIDELCRKYHNESVHSEQVARLALRLFDLTRSAHQLPAADRAILNAAARLHDVGYSVDARHHREKSAEIVRREGLKGFRDSQRAVVAATLLFHAQDIEPSRQHPLVRNLPDPARAIRLGALLRMADGLDSGHLQDAAIVSVRCGQRKVRVFVRSPLFPANVEHAGQKADLWRETYPTGIEFVPASPVKTVVTLLNPDVSVLEAARRLLVRPSKIVAVNVPGALLGQDIECLHDLRVAIRRLRVVLRTFRKPLARTPAKELDRVLQRLNQALGPVRDWDVWVNFLSQMELAGNRRWAAFVRHQIETRQLQLPTARRHLRGPAFRALQRKLDRLGRLELPRLIDTSPPESLEKFARRAFTKQLGRALKLAKLRRSTQPDDLHRLRIALRKARYLGEFFAPVLGTPVDKLTRRLHAVERVLATIHDMDVHLAKIATQGPPPPRLLSLTLAERRRKALANIEKEWARLKTVLEKP